MTARHAEEFTAVGIAQWFKDPLAFELASRMTPGRIPALRAIEGAMIAALREVARTGGKYIGDAPPHIWLTARLIASARNPLAGDPAVTLVAAELRRLTGDPRPMFAIASDLLHTIGSLGETDPSEESAI